MPVFLDHQDFIWGMGLLLSGFFIYYLVYKYGVTRFRENLINSRYSDIRIGKWFDILFKYVIPMELGALVLWYVVQSLLAEPMAEWWMSGPIGLALVVLEWGIAILALRWISKKVANRVSDPELDMDRSIDLDAEDELVPIEDVEVGGPSGSPSMGG